MVMRYGPPSWKYIPDRYSNKVFKDPIGDLVLYKDFKMVADKNTEMRKLLADLEWSAECLLLDGQVYNACVCCYQSEEDGHAEDCKLSEILYGPRDTDDRDHDDNVKRGEV